MKPSKGSFALARAPNKAPKATSAVCINLHLHQGESLAGQLTQNFLTANGESRRL